MLSFKSVVVSSLLLKFIPTKYGSLFTPLTTPVLLEMTLQNPTTIHVGELLGGVCTGACVVSRPPVIPQIVPQPPPAFISVTFQAH